MTTDALAATLDAENATIFTYGVVAAYAAAARAQTIAEFTAEHRSRREELTAALTTAATEVPEAAPGYDLPQPITDPVSALTVALSTEEDCTIAYRALLERAEDAAVRSLALGGLTDSARRAATWRLALRISPSTVALPGSTI
ncbi:ferritin-like domain-containing protein [Williamsia muralis]|uniref:ferritin-like domain-containing protein n=1 Tax=Williamsia marianensis TaxID=85044 RepID=UPI003F5CF713